jgi:hypothetical protein
MAWIDEHGLYVCNECREQEPEETDERYFGPVEACSACDKVRR